MEKGGRDVSCLVLSATAPDAVSPVLWDAVDIAPILPVEMRCFFVLPVAYSLYTLHGFR